MRECPAWWLAAARKTFYLCSRTVRFVKAPGRPQKSPERDGRRSPAEDHPRRHGRLLRIRRAAIRRILRRRRLYFPRGRQQKDYRMAHVFVTGSADGLGKMAAELLIEQGHKVVLHARSAVRADEIRKTIAGAEEDIVVCDLASIAETGSVAHQGNKLG